MVIHSEVVVHHCNKHFSQVNNIKKMKFIIFTIQPKGIYTTFESVVRDLRHKRELNLYAHVYELCAIITYVWAGGAFVDT